MVKKIILVLSFLIEFEKFKKYTGNRNIFINIQPVPYDPNKYNRADPIKLFESINENEIQGKPCHKFAIIISNIIKNNGIKKISYLENLKYLNKINKIPKINEIVKINKNEK